MADLSERLESMLEEAREELTRADNKASILLAGGGVAVGALMAALLAGDWSPTLLSSSARYFWWLSVALLAVALALLGLAVFPTTLPPSRSDRPIAYYADVVRVGRDDLIDALAKESNIDAVADQLFNISTIVLRKYRYIRWAMVAFCASVVINLLSLVVNAM